ncbi:MAG: reverse transcriptase N-terminal domain-containing protein [Spirulinaceae cyanobacterium]
MRYTHRSLAIAAVGLFGSQQAKSSALRSESEGLAHVNWRKTNRIVPNLRQRIFRAMTEGNLKKVRSLQKLMLRCYSNRLQSVRKVTQYNRGKYTPGVDKVVVKTPAARGKLVAQLAHSTASPSA